MNSSWMQLLGSALNASADIYSSSKDWQTAQLGYESQLELIELEREKMASQQRSMVLIIATIIILVLIALIALKKK